MMLDRDLNDLECSFIGNVVKDVSQYLELIKIPRENPTILLLPPVNNHMRFLVHTLIQKVYAEEKLFSISLGKFEARRIAIFPIALKKCEEVGKDKMEGYTSVVRGKPLESRNRDREGKARKPDLQVYVPRAKRLNEEVSRLKRKNDDINLIEQLINKKQEHFESETRKIVEISGVFDEQQEPENDISYDLEYIDPTIIDELISTVGKVLITHAKEDYKSFQSVSERSAEGYFILEIYNFPAEFKTRDLLNIFQMYTDFKLQWVDDTHALGIFSSPDVADLVLGTKFPMVRTRPLKEAIAKSRLKAKNFMMLPAIRPKTCTAAARRLVSNALGVKIAVNPSVRAAEIKMLREAKEEKDRLNRKRINCSSNEE